MEWLTYANQSAIRNDPLSPRLVDALQQALDGTGVSVRVFSGGQEAAGPNRTGSRRHDHGEAADVLVFKDGRQLDWSNPDDVPVFQAIVRRGKAAGLTGFGAGPGYMLPGSMHVGFGAPAVWGDGGKGANAPAWLRTAFYGGQQGVEQAEAQAPQAAPAGPSMGTAMGGFSGGPVQVAARNPGGILPAVAEATGDFRPTNFQRQAARQAMEGDQSQRARLLEAAGLDATGKARTAPRGTDSNPLGGILAKLKDPAGGTPDQGPDGGILARLLNLFA